MKIGIPTNNRDKVEEHFGHCKEFALFDVEEGKVKSITYVTPPPHEPGVIPKFLAELNASVIICGGMGQMAINLFKENNIEVILGAAGSVEDNLQEFIEGKLLSTGSACQHDHQ